MIVEVLVTLFCTLVFFTLYVRYCWYGRQLAKIPGPKRWPLIGNSLDAMVHNPESIFKFVRDLNKKYGPINKLTAFFVAVVNVSNPDYVEKLLSTPRFNEKQMPYNFLRNWLCEGLLVSNGQKWKKRRKLLTPAFHFTILKNFFRTISDQTETFLMNMQLELDKDHTDIVPLISRFTLSVMCETSMGTSIKNSETIINKYFNALAVFGKIVETRLARIWFHFDWIYKLFPLYKTEMILVNDLHSFTQGIIDERKLLKDNNNVKVENSETFDKPRSAMLDLLLENEKEDQIGIKGVREEVDTFLFEGHDTTAMALSFMIMRIANESVIQNKIYEELCTIFGDSNRPPSFEDLHKMNYLECCIKESLRIYPSVHLIARYISEDVMLGRYVLPKGAVAIIHIFDVHRNPEIYPDPEEFIPERFLPEASAARHPYAYIPFSAGPRNCIGQKFAMLEMKTVMSGILRRFRLDPVTKPQDIVFLGDIVLRSRDPLLVRIQPRVKNV